MTQLDMQLRLKVLAAVAFVLLIADIGALIFIIVPMARESARRTVSTYVAARSLPRSELALLLATRDPRTPWPTRTPTRTATPWSVVRSSPEPTRTATAAPTETTVPMETSAMSRIIPTSATPSPSAQTTSSVLVTIPTPTLRPDAVAASASPTATLAAIASPTAASPPTAGTDASASPTPASPPTETVGPPQMPESSETPAGNVGETPPPPAPPFTPGDEAQFEDYVRGQYDSIAGQSLNVVAVTLEYMANLGIPRLLVDIGASDTDNVFASQPAAVLTDYGRRLLGDTKLYFGDQYCAVTVKSTYKTANGNACVHYPGWCHVVDYNESADTWTVSWTYVWANATRGPDNIVAWNAGQ